MRQTDCHQCGKTGVPLNETIKIDGSVFCADCLKSNFTDKKELEGKKIEKEIDPTICASCGQDFGSLVLDKIATYHVCADCVTKIKNRTFPLWVKAFLGGVAAIVIFSFFWNWKYYEAYKNIKKSGDYVIKEDYAKAAETMTAASKVVTELEEIKTMASLYHGVDLLTKDKSAEALVEFNYCKDKVPPDININSLIIQAKIGSSFDRKDYEGFLTAAKENLALDSTKAMSLTSVASAYACIYADKGNEEARNLAIHYLDKAKTIDSTSKEMKGYYNRIEHRLYSKKIIRSEEFDKQFPNGWIKN